MDLAASFYWPSLQDIGQVFAWAIFFGALPMWYFIAKQLKPRMGWHSALLVAMPITFALVVVMGMTIGVLFGL